MKINKNRFKGRLAITFGIIFSLLCVSVISLIELDSPLLYGSLLEEYPLFFEGFFGFITSFGYLAIVSGRQYLAKERTIEQQLSSSGKQPILYLRSFDSEKENEVSFDLGSGLIQIERTLEMKIKSATKSLGPLIAIGNPQEDMPTLGATRSYYKNEEWKTYFLQYSSKAQLIILSVGLTQTVMWELSELLLMNLQNKLLLHVNLPKTEWNYFIADFKQKNPGLHCEFPDTVTKPALLYFENKKAICYKPPGKIKLMINMFSKEADYYLVKIYLTEFKGVKKSWLVGITILMAIMLVSVLLLLYISSRLIEIVFA